MELQCDGKPDCLDRSDETVEGCYDFNECPASWFRCAYGACIPESKVCNRIQDCLDNSDEMLYACESLLSNSTCKPNEFQCHDMEQCISIDQLCNGVVDCSDESDETLDECSNFQCTTISSNYFQCDYGGCIPADAVGNNISDCADSSDESLKDEDHSFCNGVIDQDDAVDEISPNCINLACPKTLWSCTNNEGCFRQDMMCDGNFDCLDKSDELECYQNYQSDNVIAKDDGKRSLFYCGGGERIGTDKVCNGIVDCKDFSDEGLDLSLAGSNCPKSCIKCVGGACVLKNDTYEYPVDCRDGNVSSNVCFQRLDQCGKDEFLCNDGDCVSIDDVCDGMADCEDSSDETINLCINFQCDSTQFKCRYGACIGRGRVCNGVDDCVDNSDEILSFCEDNRVKDIALLDNHVWDRSCKNLAGQYLFDEMSIFILILHLLV